MRHSSSEVELEKMAREQSCGVCNVQLPTASVARQHQAETQHLLDRYCPTCHKLFGDARGLRRHRKAKHASTPEQHLTGPEDVVQIVATIRPATMSGQAAMSARSQPSPPTPAKSQGPAPAPLAQLTGHVKERHKRDRERPKDDGPLFTPPPVYSTVNITDSSTFPHGPNQYTLYSPASQTILLSALSLRVHPRDRLTKHKFIFPDEQPSEFKDHLPVGLNAADFTFSPVFLPLREKRSAVVLDCEMVGVSHKRAVGKDFEIVERSELGQLVAVDFLTGEVLIDSLVSPTGHVMNWRSRYSGITYPAVKAARQNGTLLLGWRAARQELFRYIDSRTILIGHDLPNDLQMLRLKHGRYVDTTILTSEAVFGTEKLRRTWGLKELGKMLLDMKIQTGGRKGHDCLEDVLATREVAIWCIRFPQRLSAWAEEMRVQWEAETLARKQKLEEQRKKREEERSIREAAERIAQESEWQREEGDKLALQAAVASAKANYATEASAPWTDDTKGKASYETARVEMAPTSEEKGFWAAIAQVKAEFEAEMAREDPPDCDAGGKAEVSSSAAASVAQKYDQDGLIDFSTP